MYRIYLIFIFSLFSCKISVENKKTEKQEIEEKITKLNKEKGISVKEEFDIFFKKFGRDSIFQRERLMDTVKFYTYNDYDKLVMAKYVKKDFSFRDYTKDSLVYKEKYNAYNVEKKITKDSIIYYLWGIDNGIHKFYVFKIDNANKWYLTTIHDYSN